MIGRERQQQIEATVWTTAVRQRVAELRRHPGHDGPTVCACAECVLAHLLNAALNEVEFWHKEANGERRAHDKTTTRLWGLQDTLAEYEAALEQIASQQQETLRVIESNGFVFDDIGAEPGNWQHLAFTIYSHVCEIDTIARAALALNTDGQATER